MKCVNCGTELKDGTQFCVNCGFKQTQGDAPAEETAAEAAPVLSVEQNEAEEVVVPTEELPFPEVEAAPEVVGMPETVEAQPEAVEEPTVVAEPTVVVAPAEKTAAELKAELNAAQKAEKQAAKAAKKEQQLAAANGKVISAWLYALLLIVGGIPVVGLIVNLITMAAAKNPSLKNFSKAVVIISLVVIIVLLIGAIVGWIFLDEIEEFFLSNNFKIGDLIFSINKN